MDDRRAVGKAAVLTLCWIVSSAAFFVPLVKTGSFSLFLQVFVPTAMIFGYVYLWYIPRVFARWHLWAAAALFAAVVTVGASYGNTGTAELVTNQPWKALVYFLGRVPAFYMGMVLLLAMMDKGRALHRRYPAAAYALALLVCWLPYLYALWPGSLSAQAAAQLSAGLGADAVPGGSPLLHAGLVGLAMWAGEGVFGTADAAAALYVLAQALAMAWLLGWLVSMVAADSAPKWLVLSALLFFALCPVFPLYAFAVSADSSFALAALWLTLWVWRISRGGKPTPQTVIALCASAVLCALLRDRGIWIAALPLAALLIGSLSKRGEAWKGAMYALACAACALFVVQTALAPMIPVSGERETAARQAPFQYGYLMPGYVSDSEPAFLLGTAEGAESSPVPAANQNAAAVEAVFRRLLTYAPFRILASPGVYGWIALFALAVLLARKRWTALIPLLAPLAVLAACMASPVNGSLGCALPVCLAAPVFLAAVARAARRGAKQEDLHDRRPLEHEM